MAKTKPKTETVLPTIDSDAKVFNPLDVFSRLTGKIVPKSKCFSNMTKAYTKTIDNEFIGGDVDLHKIINSSSEKTLDAMLDKHSLNESNNLKFTLDRLLSLSKSNPVGQLYDHTGKIITDTATIEKSLSTVSGKLKHATEIANMFNDELNKKMSGIVAPADTAHTDTAHADFVTPEKGDTNG